MKTFLAALPSFVLCLGATGCGPDSGVPYQRIDSPNPIARPSNALLPPLPGPLSPMSMDQIPRDERVLSVQFYISVRMLDEQKTSEFIASRSFMPKTWNNAYRTISAIDIGPMLPDGLEVSFPLPPEIATPADSDIALLYGCGGRVVADFYFIRPIPLELSFSVVDGMPRGFISADHLKPLFEICDASAVSIALKFYRSGGEVVAWEQFDITHKPREEEPRQSGGGI